MLANYAGYCNDCHIDYYFPSSKVERLQTEIKTWSSAVG